LPGTLRSRLDFGKGSGAVTSFSQADGFLEIDALAARDHAVQVARELAGGLTSGRSISVTDEKGVVVFKTEIPDE
jgi:hypothetical protein